MKFELKIDEKKCNGCGNCVTICPINAVEASDIVLRIKDGDAILFTPEKCDGCGVCVEACPVNAIEITVEKILPSERVIDTSTKVVPEVEATRLTATIEVEKAKVPAEVLQKITADLKTLNKLIDKPKIRLLVESGKDEQAWNELKKLKGEKVEP